jgi:hypothetical protein
MSADDYKNHPGYTKLDADERLNFDSMVKIDRFKVDYPDLYHVLNLQVSKNAKMEIEKSDFMTAWSSLNDQLFMAYKILKEDYNIPNIYLIR